MPLPTMGMVAQPGGRFCPEERRSYRLRRLGLVLYILLMLAIGMFSFFYFFG